MSGSKSGLPSVQLVSITVKYSLYCAKQQDLTSNDICRQSGPLTTLHCTEIETEVNKKITKVNAALQSEVQTNNDGNKIKMGTETVGIFVSLL